MDPSDTVIPTIPNQDMQELIDEAMQNQAILNVGAIGHVANGKTTVTGYLTGITTTKHSSEKTQNKTIRLGYANVKIWRCARCNSYDATGSGVFQNACDCETNQSRELKTHISIVDCPGHNMLISTMLNGSSVMDYTMLVESATNKDCPAPQTAEHFRATKIAGIPNAMILMNKIDIVKRNRIEAKIAKLCEYVRQETGISETESISPIVPVSATFGTNLDVVCEYLSKLPIPVDRDIHGTFEMLVIRSFDVNRPGTGATGKGGTDVRQIKGGVIGGTVMRGRLNIDDMVVILPGRYARLTADQKKLHNTEADFNYSPIRCSVKSIQSEKNNMKMAIPGGLLAVQVTIDPAHTRNDGLTGSVVTHYDSYVQNRDSYRVYDKIVIRMESFMIHKVKVKAKLPKNAVIKVNVNSNTIKAMVLNYSKTTEELRLFLVRPIPITDLNDYVTVMFDNSTSNVQSAENAQNAQNSNSVDDNIDTSVLGAGRIIDGIEALHM